MYTMCSLKREAEKEREVGRGHDNSGYGGVGKGSYEQNTLYAYIKFTKIE